ncbi:hypothetical protein EI427_20635 [Flammeovirga pectinis]|uniref:DNA/RNA non-specific endonuclease n=1 Tax=Flammeovirga pectinis TaxID=2494373 RepID=A0A3Q9FS20_9BACT|nr:DUF5689 domain-containing protein [Flammeovirga pectinis]AZQ64633.1 hypothetical protein EI427_20635 [Flammeovirga pectinis]
MNHIFNKGRLIIISLCLFLSACVDTDYTNPSEINKALPTATLSIAELKALHIGGDNDTTSIPSNIIIKGQVVSSDKEGNIYKELYIQDATGGILVRVDMSPVYTKFQLGQEISIACGNLVLGSYASNIQLGIPSLNKGVPAAGRIPSPLIQQYFSTGEVKEVAIATITVKELIENLSTYAGKRVKIDSLTVINNDAGKTFADAVNEATENRYFNDASTTENINVRTSGFSDFAGDKLPEGKGTIYGVVSRFRDEPQLIINNPREDVIDFKAVENQKPSGPIAIKTVDQLNEAFDGTTKYDEIALENWLNISEEGTRKWYINDYKGNTYANISVFKANEKRVNWLITPKLNVVAAKDKTISFRTRQEYSTGAVLKVMVSANYDGSAAPSDAKFTWTEVNAKLSNDGQSGYGSWTTSGAVDLSSYGNVVVAFYYEGEEGVTDGGYSIDDIVFNYTKDPIIPGQGYVLLDTIKSDHTLIPSTTAQFSYTDQEIIRHDGYYLAYNEDTENPIWVAYVLTAADVSGSISRTDDFRIDTSISTKSTNSKSFRTGGSLNYTYDRGHIKPASDSKLSASEMSDSFYMSNMSPQTSELNQKEWRFLEEHVRDLATQNGKIYVVSGPVLDKNYHEWIDRGVDDDGDGDIDKVAVPKAYYKVVLVLKNGTPEVHAWILPNKDKSQGNLNKYSTYKVTLQELETRTNIDFFNRVQGL